MLAVLCLALGSFQLAIATSSSSLYWCNTCQQCVPSLAEIMQEIDSETSNRNVLPSQIQIVNSKDFVTIQVSGSVPGWNKRAKSVFFEKYKTCQKGVEAANLRLPSTNSCRKECRNIRFVPVQKVYDTKLKRLIDLFKYPSSKKRFLITKTVKDRKAVEGAKTRRQIKRRQRRSPTRRQNKRQARRQIYNRRRRL
jgi:hypothetical protein